MAKIHLVQSQTPLSEGRDHDTICGKTLIRPTFGAMCDGDEFGGFVAEMHNCINICQKCVERGWTERYLYAAKERKNEHQPITPNAA